MVLRIVSLIVFLLPISCMLPGTLWAEEAPAAAVEDPETLESVMALLEDAHERYEGVDARMAALEEQRNALRREAREAQRDRVDVRQHILQEDEELKEMVAQLEERQRELHALQEAIAQRMAQHPDYRAHHEGQTGAIERAGELQREIMLLANDRVAVQLEIQALEKRWTELADEPDGDDSEPINAPLSVEDVKTL